MGTGILAGGRSPETNQNTRFMSEPEYLYYQQQILFLEMMRFLGVTESRKKYVLCHLIKLGKNIT